MQIQFNTDHNIEGRDKMAEYYSGVLERDLSRFSDQITRLEVHLSDENGHKNGPEDKRCMIEARLQGLKPTSVTHYAETLAQAISGATDKLKRSLGSTIDQIQERH
jgi:ribosome-associated translation inhibitor RaiA